MADTKITALAAITTVAPANDLFAIVDVSDNSMAASGTTKNITTNQILGAGGTATLASATITGDLTVRSGNKLKLFRSDNAISTDFSDGGSGVGTIINNLNIDGFRLRLGGNNVYNVAGDGSYTQTWFNGGGGTWMTLNSTGLGIGTGPSYNIDVLGATLPTISVRSTLAGASNARLYLECAGTNSGHITYNRSLQALTLGANGGTTAQVTLDSAGNCGIGVTPSAWGTTYRALQIGIGTSLTGVTNDVDLNLTNNARFDGTNWKYLASSPAERYRIAVGTHYWYNAVSGTAGNNVTWTQAMTLDASGNLLVGKTVSSFSTVGVEASQAGFLSLTNSASTNAATNVSVYSTGAAAFRFYVGLAGTVFATNTTISAISDARLKENVQDIDVGLNAILSLKPRKFDWKEGKGKDIKGDRGFIAQEFETVFPNLIDEWKDEAPEGEAPYKSVRQDLIPVLVKAIQELTARVQTLEAK